MEVVIGLCHIEVCVNYTFIDLSESVFIVYGKLW